MSLLFWRKRDSYGQEAAAVVSRADPMPVFPMRPEETDDPFPVKLEQDYLPPVAGETVERIVEVPGITTGAAHSDGDAFGTLITFRDVFRPEKRSGTIVGAFLLDLDDEGLQVDIPIFVHSITATADDSAFAPTDADLLACRAVVSITSFYNWSSNQFGQATGLPMWVRGEETHLYTQLVVRGAANIAAGAIPRVGLVIVPD